MDFKKVEIGGGHNPRGDGFINVSTVLAHWLT